MHKDVQQELDINFGIDQTFRLLIINHPSSCTSSFKNLESSAAADTVSEIDEVLSNVYKVYSVSERGTVLVDVELTRFEWEALHLESSRQGVDSDRCLKKKMGSTMQGSSNWGLVVQG